MGPRCRTQPRRVPELPRSMTSPVRRDRRSPTPSTPPLPIRLAHDIAPIARNAAAVPAHPRPPNSRGSRCRPSRGADISARWRDRLVAGTDIGRTMARRGATATNGSPSVRHHRSGIRVRLSKLLPVALVSALWPHPNAMPCVLAFDRHKNERSGTCGNVGPSRETDISYLFKEPPSETHWATSASCRELRHALLRFDARPRSSAEISRRRATRTRP